LIFATFRRWRRAIEGLRYNAAAVRTLTIRKLEALIEPYLAPTLAAH
jgi:hypothetical protein